MIDPNLREPAIRALHDLLIDARNFAYEGAKDKKIATLLDYMDYLFHLLEEPEDRTDLFVGVLNEVAERLDCRRAYNRFAQHLEPVG